MRDILFRGKRIDNGEWVEGGYFLEPYTDKTFIVTWNSFGLGFIDYIEVVPETVGQYTGLNDMNGKRIFEGDIFRCDNAMGYVRFGTYASVYANKNTHIGFFIEWIIDRMLRIDLAFWTEQRKIEVIGNIHDNPELLKVEGEQ